jgi:lipid A 3-O-deacylase
MHWIYFRNFLAMCLLGSPLMVYAGTDARMGIAVGSGIGVLHIIPYRLAVLKDLGPLAFKEKEWVLKGYWELSAGYWESYKNIEGNKQLILWTTGPQCRLQRATPFQSGIQPYLELGIGASWLSNQRIAGRDVGMQFLFEDRIGFGFRFGQKQKYDITARAMHYSHASLVPHNPGINMFLTTIGCWF